MGTLRSQLFPTQPREVTKFICVRDTLHRPKEAKLITMMALDAEHCRRGKFGVGFHFVVFLDGSYYSARHIDTIGNHSKDFNHVSVAIGVVGGKNEDDKRDYTRTPAQEAAITELIELLQARYPEAVVDDQYQKY